MIDEYHQGTGPLERGWWTVRTNINIQLLCITRKSGFQQKIGLLYSKSKLRYHSSTL